MEARTSPNADLQPLKVLSDRYVLIKVLGHGAFATSYLGEDKRNHNRRVVIKLFSGNQSAGPALFNNEGRVSSGLFHPNIVSLLGMGVSEDAKPFLVTEWIQGESLASILRRSGPLAVIDGVSVGIGLGSALAYLHGRDLLHRDLKPSNVLIPGWPERPDYRGVKVLDFGVAGQLQDGVTQSGAVFGTPRYMSPEQILGEPQSAATDVYGFGLLLLEMLVGHAPSDRSRSATLLFRAILEGQTPENDLAALPADLATLIRGCLHRDPAERPSVQEILKVLRAYRSASAATSVVIKEAAPATPNAPQPASTDVSASKPQAPPQVPLVPAPPARCAVANPEPAVKPIPQPSRQRMPWLLVALSGALAVAVPLLVYSAIWHARHATHHSHWLRILEFLVGLLVMCASIVVAFWLRSWLGRGSSASSHPDELVLGTNNKLDLTATMALELDELVTRLRSLDDRLLAGPAELMLKEISTTSDPENRQKAIMNLSTLLEKLADRSHTPWYQRYKEVIASAVAVMGGASGLITAVNSVLAHKH